MQIILRSPPPPNVLVRDTTPTAALIGHCLKPFDAFDSQTQHQTFSRRKKLHKQHKVSTQVSMRVLTPTFQTARRSDSSSRFRSELRRSNLKTYSQHMIGIHILHALLPTNQPVRNMQFKIMPKLIHVFQQSSQKGELRLSLIECWCVNHKVSKFSYVVRYNGHKRDTCTISCIFHNI